MERPVSGLRVVNYNKHISSAIAYNKAHGNVLRFLTASDRQVC